LTWIDKRDNWITSGGRLQRPREEARPAARPRKDVVAPSDEPLWTVADISRVLNIHEDTVYKLIGNMPAGAIIRIGDLRMIRVKNWAVQDLLEEV